MHHCSSKQAASMVGEATKLLSKVYFLLRQDLAFLESLILELTHGLETQCKLMYRARHGHVIMKCQRKWLRNGLIHELYGNLILTIVVYCEYKPWLTSVAVKPTLSLHKTLDKTTWMAPYKPVV